MQYHISRSQRLEKAGPLAYGGVAEMESIKKPGHIDRAYRAQDSGRCQEPQSKRLKD